MPHCFITSDTDVEDMCYGYQTCTECREDPACGWCDDGTGTGVGACRVGGASGPLEKMAQREISSSHVQWIAADTCSTSQQKSWHFTSCPGSTILTLFYAIFQRERTVNCHSLGQFKRLWSMVSAPYLTDLGRPRSRDYELPTIVCQTDQKYGI